MPNAPSLIRLEQDFPQIDIANLKLIRRKIQKGLPPETTMQAIDKLLENFGVEAINNKSGNTIALYSNSGDTYNATILYAYESDTYRLTTWGDYVETYERNRARLD